MSTVAALAVASPAAVVAVTHLSSSSTADDPAQHREFVQAAMVTDLPGELMSALSQGLSQFGINLPPMPTGLLTGSGASTPATLTTPGLTTPGLGASPLTTPGLGVPGLQTPGLTTPGLTAPGASLPPLTGTGPALTDPSLTNPALSNPALTNPAGALTNPAGALTNPAGALAPGATPTAPGLTGLTPGATPGVTPGLTPGLTTPPALGDPSLTSPLATAGLPGQTPIGLDPSAGSYPLLGGDPSLASAAPASTGSGGLMGDLTSAAQQLGAGQAIDLLKGVLMPAIMSAIKPAGAPAAAAAAAPITQAIGQAAPAALPPIPGT